MGLFRPYEQGKTETEAQQRRRRPRGATRADLARDPEPKATPRVADPVDPALHDEQPRSSRQPQKKGAPTPTRAQAQAARMERLHPTLSPKEQRRASRESERERRQQSLQRTEASPARQLARDHVDSRFTITEWTLPLMLVVLAVSMFFPRNYAVQQANSIAMMVLFLLWLANIFWVRRSFLREARERGVDVRQPGMTMYLVNRMMSLRPMRRPEPRVKRGETY